MHGTPRNHYVRTSLTRWVARWALTPLSSLQRGLIAPSLPEQESASNRTTIDHSRTTTFFDRLFPSQMDVISKGCLLIFVQNRTGFRAIESPSFIEVVSRTRPACVTTQPPQSGRLDSVRSVYGRQEARHGLARVVGQARHRHSRP
jgi:hypothetical protein